MWATKRNLDARSPFCVDGYGPPKRKPWPCAIGSLRESLAQQGATSLLWRRIPLGQQNQKENNTKKETPAPVERKPTEGHGNVGVITVDDGVNGTWNQEYRFHGWPVAGVWEIHQCGQRRSNRGREGSIGATRAHRSTPYPSLSCPRSLPAQLAFGNKAVVKGPHLVIFFGKRSKREGQTRH